jgi:hypothetical protein
MAIKKIGIERVLKKLNSNVIDAYAEYKLHEVDLFGNKEKLLEMKNHSEDKTHYEWILPEINKVKDALAWRCGLSNYIEPIAKT